MFPPHVHSCFVPQWRTCVSPQMSAAKAAFLGAMFAGGYRMASGPDATVPPFTVTCLIALVESAIAAGDARYLEQLTAVRAHTRGCG